MKSVAIIPSRYGSTRFQGKPIAILNGKPMIQYVYEGASKAKLIEYVLVATDDKRIFDVVKGFGGKAVMTRNDHSSGSDRIAEVARNLVFDIIVNIQGDEPMIHGEMVDDVIMLLDDSRSSIGTLKKRIEDGDDLLNPNIVKVVTDREGFALYFSRSPIPFFRDNFSRIQDTDCEKNMEFYKHIGIYSYRKDVLLQLASMPPGILEKAEKLEQLRALENNIRIKVKETLHESIGVDTYEDLKRVERWLNTFS